MNVVKLTQPGSSIVQQIIKYHLEDADKKEQPPSAAHIQKLLSDERTYLLACIEKDIVLGYILCYRFPSLYTSAWLAYLYDIEVAAVYRRQGVATLLLSTLFNQLKADNVTEVWLGTATDNEEGQAFFTATGGIKNNDTFNDYTYYL